MATDTRPSFLRVWILAAFLIFVACFIWFRPKSVETLLGEAQNALNAGQLQRAIETSEQVVEREPGSVSGWTILARATWLAGDWTKWEQASERLAEFDSESAFELCLETGSQEMQRLQAAPAERALRRAIEISPDRPEPWRLLSQLLSIQGRPHDTTECLLALIRLGDFTSNDLHSLAWPSSAISEPDRVESLLAADADNRIPLLAFVGAALNENDIEKALRLLRQILERNPDHPRSNALLGLLLSEQDSPEFLTWQKERSAVANSEPETWQARGIWLAQHSQVEAAAACFHQAVVRDPRHLNSLSQLGGALKSIGEVSLAAEFLEWARLQQEVIQFSRRIRERGESRDSRSLIEHLEKVGRLWEAWAWCRAYKHAWPEDGFAAEHLKHLEPFLTPELPRTKPELVPGRDFDWTNLAQPVWSDSSSPAVDHNSDSGETAFAFVDEASRVGIDFHFENGPVTDQTIVQTGGGGVAALDYDLDGWCDLYFTQGGSDPGSTVQSAIDMLYRNINGKRFQEVALSANLHEDHFSQGAAVGDFDNDGFPDLYVANLSQNRLYRNNGDGTFSDVTDSAGLLRTDWTTSCAIADLNRDGNPELFDVCYAGGPEIITRVCREPSGRAAVCRPTLFPAAEDSVAINNGEGQFRELSFEAGIDLPDGRGFGLVVADYNEDGRLDVFVSNDQTANFLLIQQESPEGQLRFADEAILSGVAFDRDGFPQACMGIASGDLNNDGRTDLFVTNFADESNTLYTSQPYGGFQDATREARLRDPSFRSLGFGTQFLDVDLDGRLDLILLNGHIHDTSDPTRSPAMRPQLFRGLADGSFDEIVGDEASVFFHAPRIGRGLCTLDWNRDGSLDFAASFLDGRAALGTNHSARAGHWLTLDMVGVQSSRDAVGTRIRLTLTDGSEKLWQSTAGDGFAASNERQLQLGLGANSHVTELEIHWPSGLTQRFQDLQSDSRWTAIEGRDRLFPQ